MYQSKYKARHKDRRAENAELLAKLPTPEEFSQEEQRRATWPYPSTAASCVTGTTRTYHMDNWDSNE